jgi:hypothetical protein
MLHGKRRVEVRLVVFDVLAIKCRKATGDTRWK